MCFFSSSFSFLLFFSSPPRLVFSQSAQVTAELNYFSSLIATKQVDKEHENVFRIKDLFDDRCSSHTPLFFLSHFVKFFYSYFGVSAENEADESTAMFRMWNADIVIPSRATGTKGYAKELAEKLDISPEEENSSSAARSREEEDLFDLIE